jgi:hypothetical protein
MTALFSHEEMTWEPEPGTVACFFCANPLRLPAIHWLGAQGHVYVDRVCFSDLFVRLAVDAHVIDRRWRWA